MTSSTTRTSGLEAHGITAARPVHWNLTPAVLYEHALRREEGSHRRRRAARLPHRPAHRPVAERQVHRQGRGQRPARPLGQGQPADDRRTHFAALRADVVAHLGQRELFVQDLHAGADPVYRLPVRMISEYAWHSLFVRNLFIVPTDGERRTHVARVHGDVRADVPGRRRPGTGRDRTWSSP